MAAAAQAIVWGPHTKTLTADLSHAIGSVTSIPSLQSPVPTAVRKSSHIHELSDEAKIFCADLRNFLPLGCLCFEDAGAIDSDAPHPEWLDVEQLAGTLINSSPLGPHIARLLEAGWIRIQSSRSSRDRRFVVYRVYVLPADVGNRLFDRQSSRLRSALEHAVLEIDPSDVTWRGDYSGINARIDTFATAEEGSLFYRFNTLPSPSPSPSVVEEKYAREALEDLLDPTSVLAGLKTVLYPYQRRSAGLMLQRESSSTLQLDPRLEPRTAPDGSRFYYSARELLFFRAARYFETCRGGILAETMGLGKTVIILSLILATKHHLPKVPAGHHTPKQRSSVASLTEMAIASINRRSIPWKVECERMRHATGIDTSRWEARISSSLPCYEIERQPQRWNRNTVTPPPRKIIMASTTIIVVPRDLCKQWGSEIAKHVEHGTLSVLVMEDLRRALPPPEELRTYDIVLFSRNRFALEVRDGSDEQGRRILATQLACRCPYIGATRVRDCHCVRTDDLYDSPLKHLHFKRLIIDEGHFFSNNNNAAVMVANKLVTADHRWVVSGTPAKDLLGVEVDMSAAENMWQTPETKGSREAILSQRRTYSAREEINGAVRSLGSLATNFLRIHPWAPHEAEHQKAEWDEYIYRHEHPRKRTYSAFSSCLRRTLEAMVIKTQPEDVEKDIELPPLSHEVVRLEPSFYDKLTANLFTLVLTANAVTSERTDADYLFHKNSAKARYQLISNLRQSAFFWTGFSKADIEAGVKNSLGYLAKEDTKCTPEDRRLLEDMVAFAETVILASPGWQALSTSHELGLFVRNWPSESAEHWSFGQATEPLFTGVSQLLVAQQYVNERTTLHDPGEGLAGAGIGALAPARAPSLAQPVTEAEVITKKLRRLTKKRKRPSASAESPILTRAGIPLSSLDGEPNLKRRASLSARSAKTKNQSKVSDTFKTKKRPYQGDTSIDDEAGKTTDSLATDEAAPASPKTAMRKRSKSNVELQDLPIESPYLASRVVGTSSAKLSYLISQILRYQEDEKILVFYDGDNVAYYIAQMLELLHIKHEIFAKSLAAPLKSEYVVRFDQEPQDRVLLMDVKQAAFGLNLSSASRIYFVNPVCRPNIEAQAIKRAHRIGQTRKVYVETLVLKGSIEEKMLDRSKRMTRAEHLDAKVLEDDDGIREIIQSSRLLPISEDEKSGAGQMAPLEVPQQLWGRSGWRGTVKNPIIRPVDSATTDGDATATDGARSNRDGAAHPPKRAKLAFVDCTAADDSAVVIDEGDSDDEPLIKRRQSASALAARPLLTSLTKDIDTDILRPDFSPIGTPPPSMGRPTIKPLESKIRFAEETSRTEEEHDTDEKPIGLVQKIVQWL